VIFIKLREAMEAHRRRTGDRLTYDELAERTGLSRATLEAIGSRHGYNARLSTIERLCDALGCEVADLLERAPAPTQASARRRVAKS
jgi:putative transcriptional regulator